MSTCRSCDAEIVWALTTTGKLAPYDPDPEGMWVIESGAARLGGMFDDELERYTSHFANCTDPGRWRK